MAEGRSTNWRFRLEFVVFGVREERSTAPAARQQLGVSENEWRPRFEGRRTLDVESSMRNFEWSSDHGRDDARIGLSAAYEAFVLTVRTDAPTQTFFRAVLFVVVSRVTVWAMAITRVMRWMHSVGIVVWVVLVQRER